MERKKLEKEVKQCEHAEELGNGRHYCKLKQLEYKNSTGIMSLCYNIKDNNCIIERLYLEEERNEEKK